MTQLQADKLEGIIADRNMAQLDVVVLQSVESTNDWCLQQCRSGRELPFVCFAEMQTAGKGRRGKYWYMTAGSDIAMSLVWRVATGKQFISLLPIAIAVAIAEVLEGFGLNDVQIKWPNDVYVSDKKVAGILIEIRPIDESHLAVVIGVGLNYDMGAELKLPDEEVIAAPTDIVSEMTKQGSGTDTGKKPDRQEVAAELLSGIVTTCQHIEKDAVISLDLFRRSYDYCLGKNIDIQIEGGEVKQGVAQGVSDAAELLVLINGDIQKFNSAVVSVRAGGLSE